ncbi:cupin domain-containing protein [Luteimonas sp. RD2P54]|uniref:Cupin domain-containing protein n=1 Tax=Luteimonas endophytica TaxID=3042023 RepID=A0ABT6J745_9GAMM|nr:cupin domain-containing protein [Luteimonas endophytica]MDH5822410.1 cupin domain-containing protein [Luteimonas endophytica]
MRRWLPGLLLAACAALGAHAEAAPRRVFIAGDSTAAEYGPERAPQAGWGQVLQGYLDPGAYEVRNHARGGRSARSFIEQGLLDPVAEGLREGDVLLVQFGHNDAKFEDPARYNEPERAYPQWLMRYVALARERGATPILITPVARRLFDFGALLDTHVRYSEAVRTLARRESLALIDLDTASRDWLRALGDEASKPYFMHVPAQGKADDTHFSTAGATQVACLVVREWKRLDPELAPHVIRDTDCGAPPDALALRASQPRPSGVLRAADVAAVSQPGPHGGPGPTTAWPYFADAEGLPFAFRKRVLHPGAGIGLHPHHKDEVYYVLSGRGRFVLDGEVHQVGPGDAMLTRPGSTHALQQDGDADLEILIVYPTTP